MKPIRVLITGAGTTTAITVLKGLRATKDPAIHVTMGDMLPDCAGAHLGDDFVRMPPGNDADFGASAISICRERSIDLVIPIIDYEFLGWAQSVTQLAQMGTTVAISSVHALKICQEKDKTDAHFRSIGIPCPVTWRPSDVEPRSLPFPVMIKPRCGRGSLDIYRANNFEEYRFFLPRVPDPLVQRLLRGREVTIDTISDFEGRFLAASPRVRLAVKDGQAVKSITIDAPDLVELARRIVVSLPIIGPSNIQCFLTEEGVQFFEINPRFGAGTILSIHAGMNGPAALIAMHLRKSLPPLRPRHGVTMLRYWDEVFL